MPRARRSKHNRTDFDPWDDNSLQRIEPQDDYHVAVRTLLRVFGPSTLVLGILLIGFGVFDFFSSISTHEPPRNFWCVFLGMPFIALGATLTKLGYMGAVLRYVARETAPVASDTFNEMTDGTRGGVETLAHAVGLGLSSGLDSMRGSSQTGDCNGSPCPGCNSDNPPDARFCNQCGVKLSR